MSRAEYIFKMVDNINTHGKYLLKGVDARNISEYRLAFAPYGLYPSVLMLDFMLSDKERSVGFNQDLVEAVKEDTKAVGKDFIVLGDRVSNKNRLNVSKDVRMVREISKGIYVEHTDEGERAITNHLNLKRQSMGDRTNKEDLAIISGGEKGSRVTVSNLDTISTKDIAERSYISHSYISNELKTYKREDVFNLCTRTNLVEYTRLHTRGNGLIGSLDSAMREVGKNYLQQEDSVLQYSRLINTGRLDYLHSQINSVKEIKRPLEIIEQDMLYDRIIDLSSMGLLEAIQFNKVLSKDTVIVDKYSWGRLKGRQYPGAIYSGSVGVKAIDRLMEVDRVQSSTRDIIAKLHSIEGLAPYQVDSIRLMHTAHKQEQGHRDIINDLVVGQYLDTAHREYVSDGYISDSIKQATRTHKSGVYVIGEVQEYERQILKEDNEAIISHLDEAIRTTTQEMVQSLMEEYYRDDVSGMYVPRDLKSGGRAKKSLYKADGIHSERLSEELVNVEGLQIYNKENTRGVFITDTLGRYTRQVERLMTIRDYWIDTLINGGELAVTPAWESMLMDDMIFGELLGSYAWITDHPRYGQLQDRQGEINVNYFEGVRDKIQALVESGILTGSSQASEGLLVISKEAIRDDILTVFDNKAIQGSKVEQETYAPYADVIGSVDIREGYMDSGVEGEKLAQEKYGDTLESNLGELDYRGTEVAYGLDGETAKRRTEKITQVIGESKDREAEQAIIVSGGKEPSKAHIVNGVEGSKGLSPSQLINQAMGDKDLSGASITDVESADKEIRTSQLINQVTGNKEVRGADRVGTVNANKEVSTSQIIHQVTGSKKSRGADKTDTVNAEKGISSLQVINQVTGDKDLRGSDTLDTVTANRGEIGGEVSNVMNLRKKQNGGDFHTEQLQGEVPIKDALLPVQEVHGEREERLSSSDLTGIEFSKVGKGSELTEVHGADKKGKEGNTQEQQLGELRKLDGKISKLKEYNKEVRGEVTDTRHYADRGLGEGTVGKNGLEGDKESYNGEIGIDQLKAGREGQQGSINSEHSMANKELQEGNIARDTYEGIMGPSEGIVEGSFEYGEVKGKVAIAIMEFVYGVGEERFGNVISELQAFVKEDKLAHLMDLVDGAGGQRDRKPGTIYTNVFNGTKEYTGQVYTLIDSKKEVEGVIGKPNLMGTGILNDYNDDLLKESYDVEQWGNEYGFGVPDDYDPLDPFNTYFPYTSDYTSHELAQVIEWDHSGSPVEFKPNTGTITLNTTGTSISVPNIVGNNYKFSVNFKVSGSKDKAVDIVVKYINENYYYVFRVHGGDRDGSLGMAQPMQLYKVAYGEYTPIGYPMAPREWVRGMWHNVEVSVLENGSKLTIKMDDRLQYEVRGI